MPTKSSSKWLDRLRMTGTILVLLGATAGFATFVHLEHYPIELWLFWRYAGFWAAGLLFVAAALSSGHLVVRTVLGRSLPLLEHVAVSFSVGIFAFQLLMFVLGILGLWQRSFLFFFGVPLFLIAIGAWPSWKLWRRAIPRLRSARRRSSPLPLWKLAITLFGFLGFVMVYFLILTPQNVQFDSLWKHLAIVDDYVHSGGVRRFPEGWTTETRPHFAGFVYGWSFTFPTEELFDHLGLAAHLEYVIWAFSTLFAVPAAIRRLAPGADPRIVWATRFLFPGVLLYDSNLSAGADHIGGTFGPTILLLLLRVWPTLNLRFGVLLALLLSAASMIKYTTMALLVLSPIAAVALRALWLAGKAAFGRLPAEARRNWYLMPLAAAVLCLLFTTPHWLKNFVFYGDPLYPILYKHFDPRPWAPDAAYMYQFGFLEKNMWRPERNLEGVLITLQNLVTWPFMPNDWPQFHKEYPVFGILFTLTIPCLLFLKRTARIWGVVVWTHIGIFLWYWLHHQDRYLQGLAPLMIIVTAAILSHIWRTWKWARIPAVALVLLQVIWGGDVYFIQTHAMADSPIKKVNDLLERGFKKQYRQRMQAAGIWPAIGARIPEGAYVLVHESRDSLGLRHKGVYDNPTWQFGISYGHLKSTREVYDLLHGWGVTHMVWSKKSNAFDSVASDVMFYGFAHRYGAEKKAVRHTIAALPDQPPPAEFNDTVLVLGCSRGGYRTGLYRVSDLRTPTFGPDKKKFARPRLMPTDRTEARNWIRYASYVVGDTPCLKPAGRARLGAFQLAATRHRGGQRKYQIWVRMRGEPEAAPWK